MAVHRQINLVTYLALGTSKILPIPFRQRSTQNRKHSLAFSVVEDASFRAVLNRIIDEPSETASMLDLESKGSKSICEPLGLSFFKPASGAARPTSEDTETKARGSMTAAPFQQLNTWKGSKFLNCFLS